MSNNENEKLRLSMLSIFNKISSSHTVSVGHEMLKKILDDNDSDSKINYILTLLAENINTLKKIEKKESLKLLCIITDHISNAQNFLSRILTIIQTNISDENASLFTTLSTVFGEIAENSLRHISNRNVYELLQGFCIYNMKQENKANQICGSLCLTSLIETCPTVLEPAYMKYIWENIIFFIDKQNYHAKSELLNSLISLIFASESLFQPFATVTLYKILDYLTDNDWFKKKLALNIVYTLIIYCQDDIVPLKGHIIEFLKVLKTDKVKEVREVCLQTLKLFNEIDEELKKSKESIQEISIPRNKSSRTPLKVQSSIGSRNKSPRVEKSFELVEKKQQPRIKKNNTFDDELNISEINNEEKNKKKPNKLLSKGNISKSNRSITPTKNEDKNIKRIREGNFVNSKMIIKRDPSHSIFKTRANQDFFSNANNEEGDIKILVKNNYKKEEEPNKEKEEEILHNSIVDESVPNLIEQTHRIEYTPPRNKSEKYQDFPLQSSSNLSEPVLTTKDLVDNITTLDKKEQVCKISSSQPEVQLSDLLKQMKMISDKQILLVDSIDKIQSNAKEQFDNMNLRINKLEKTVSQLVSYIQNIKKEKDYKIRKEDFESFGNLPNKNNIMHNILLELKNNNSNQAFEIALASENINLIKLIEKINPSQIREIIPSMMEDVISRLITLITKGEYLIPIINWIKLVLITLNYSVKLSTLQNIKDMMIYISSNKNHFLIQEEDMIDVNSIITYINSKSKQGYSSLINSFSEK